jgi:hypothetical protein
MRTRALLVLFAVAGGGALALRSTVRASDHLDGPRTVADPQADITDVFAFTSPENAAHLVLAMAVTPFAGTGATFSSDVDYVFRVRRVDAPQPLTLDAAVLDVTCDFAGGDAAPQAVTCTAPGGLRASAIVGDTSGGDAGSSPAAPMRVFAGPRSDPAFFDRQGALATLQTGRASFTGQNAFALQNVLAIVVEIDTRTAFAADAGPALPMLAVAGETIRRGP